MTDAIALTEFDPERDAIVAPYTGGLTDVPERAVVCFFHEVVDAEVDAGRATWIGSFVWEDGSHDLYRVTRDGVDVDVAVYVSGVGAPLAGGMLEECIAAGVRSFVVCGGAGALVPGLALGHVVVPTSAVRDEGTSFHYAPPARSIDADARLVARAVELLDERDIPHLTGPTWTTDAIYRETPDKIRRRRDEGCLVVEMEASALIAIARFRGVDLVQLLYAGDDVSGETWDHRRWTTSSARHDLFELSLDLATRR
jgi:uridine phosphorylase